MVKRAHGKKARQVKDPYSIIRERDRGKIFNKKPADIEDQFVPRKVQDMMQFVNGEASNTSRGNKRRKHRLKNGRITSRAFVDTSAPTKGMSRPLKPIPLFEQKPNESDFKFLKRVEKMTKERMQQKKFEDKYNVDIITNLENGTTKMVSREEEGSKRKKRKKNVDEAGEEIPKKMNRKKMAKLKRKDKLEERLDDFAHLHDKVEFGDVVERPPELRSTPRRVPADGSHSKPGRRSLLLKQLYTDALVASRSSAPVSLHRKASLEEERLRAVAAYRRLKQQKMERSGPAK